MKVDSRRTAYGPPACSAAWEKLFTPAEHGSSPAPFLAAPGKLLRPAPLSRWRVPELQQGDRGQPEAGGADSPPLSGSRGLAVLSSAHAAAENTLVWPGRG